MKKGRRKKEEGRKNRCFMKEGKVGKGKVAEMRWRCWMKEEGQPLFRTSIFFIISFTCMRIELKLKTFKGVIITKLKVKRVINANFHKR